MGVWVESGQGGRQQTNESSNHTKPPSPHSYDADANVLLYTPAGSPLPPSRLTPSVVRAADTSVAAIDEWTGAPISATTASLDPDLRPVAVQAVGNYAVQITWSDGASQIAPFEQLDGIAADTSRQAVGVA